MLVSSACHRRCTVFHHEFYQSQGKPWIHLASGGLAQRVNGSLFSTPMNLACVALVFALAGVVALSSGCVSARNDVSPVSTELERRNKHSVTNGPPGEVMWPASVQIGDGLSEDEAVALALWNNAAFQETLADLGLSRADLVQAGMLPNPTLSMLIPVGAKPFELTAKYPIEVLWLRPGRVAAA